MNIQVKNLEPQAIWNYFEMLNEVPRASKKEERVIEFIKQFGLSLKLETKVDNCGNVLIKKPATSGMENKPIVVLQSHLDMVHQKNATTDFDFNTQGIQTLIDGDWVKANGTTLGADNGIGVASIMAVLASTDIKHPAIEALFTIDEETGMTGAKNLEPGFLAGKILLNLDTEDDDELCIGCAGGLDTNISWEYEVQNVKKGSHGYVIWVKGLKGGHSGMDIHLGRGNANKIMNRILYQTRRKFGVQVAEIDGGSLRNAIPRESKALVAIENVQAFLNHFISLSNDIRKELSTTEPDLTITVEQHELPEKVMSASAQENLIAAIYSMPNGVYRMSADIPDLVETSSSLARVSVKNGLFTSQSLQRSSVDSAKMDLGNAIRACFELIGAKVEQGGEYPGWTPLPDAPILHTMKQLYTDLFKEEPHVRACHAGLECGLIGDHFPGMHMISFGPTIKNPHSPDEKVNIASVGKFWTFLKKTLEDIPAMG